MKKDKPKIFFTGEFIKGWNKLFNWRYAPLRFWKEIINLPREIKWFFQRGKRGWADCDTWSLDWYLTGWLPDAIRHLASYKHGTPVRQPYKGKGIPQSKDILTEKEWGQILEKIARAFEAHRALSDPTIKNRRIDYFIKHTAPRLEKEFKEGMELFVRYFGNLWD